MKCPPPKRNRRCLLPQVSKGLAIAMQSLWAQQTARQHVVKQLAGERLHAKQRNAELTERGDTIIDFNKQVSIIRCPPASVCKAWVSMIMPHKRGPCNAGLQSMLQVRLLITKRANP